MAPDEGTYAALAGVVGPRGAWAAWNHNWGAGLYPCSRALLGPAALLVYIGLPDLTSVVSSPSCTPWARSCCCSPSRAWPGAESHQRVRRGLPLISWPMLGIAVFVLMPSNVLWSSLGLREAACAFWILGAGTCTAYLFTAQDWRWKAPCGLGIAASITMVFQSRVYLAAALVIALAVGIVWFGKERRRVSFTLIASVLLGTLLGVTASPPATASESNVLSSLQE